MTDITKTKLYKSACEDWQEWLASQHDLQTAWDTCTHPGWMLWCLQEIGWRDDKTLRLFACWCVRHTPLYDGRTVWDLLTDERSRNAVEVVERFANGDATEAELDAAWDALDAAQAAAWDAAENAAWIAAANQLRVMVPNPFVGNEVVK